ncbi:gas vesicle protein GvpM [Natrialbaceae archaeon A-CW3]
MKPNKSDDAIVDVIDVLLRDGAIIRADVVVLVADIPLIGIKLSAAIAGMETMTDYGLFQEWDTERRARAVERRQYGHRDGDSRKQSPRIDTERDDPVHPSSRPHGQARARTPASVRHPPRERERESEGSDENEWAPDREQ